MLPAVRVAASSCFVAVLLAGCSSGQPPAAAFGPLQQSVASVAPRIGPPTKKPNLYVASNGSSDAQSSVRVFAPGGTKPIRTISKGISSPMALAEDGSGNLYAANAERFYDQKSEPATVSVYAPGSRAPFLTISEGVHAPVAMAFDRGGNLYLLMGREQKRAPNITVYAPSSTKVLRRITAGLNGPTALAFDRSQNLYVANYGNSTVTVYAPGETSISRTIAVAGPTDLRFSPSGNLFVGSNAVTGRFGGKGSIEVYYPGESSPHRTIATTNGYCAYGLKFDGSGNLYSSELECGDLYYAVADEYASGSSSVLRSIRETGRLPKADALDAAGNFYVANCNSCWSLPGKDAVRMYAPGRTAPSRTIYVRAPVALTFGP